MDYIENLKSKILEPEMYNKNLHYIIVNNEDYNEYIVPFFNKVANKVENKFPNTNIDNFYRFHGVKIISSAQIPRGGLMKFYEDIFSQNFISQISEQYTDRFILLKNDKL